MRRPPSNVAAPARPAQISRFEQKEAERLRRQKIQWRNQARRRRQRADREQKFYYDGRARHGSDPQEWFYGSFLGSAAIVSILAALYGAWRLAMWLFDLALHR